MAAKCELHPGRAAADKIFGVQYCQQCVDGIVKARKKIDKHVDSKECFVVYAGKDVWNPIDGTGCAHWLLHHLGKKGGGDPVCLAGYSVRVKAAQAGRSEIARVKGGKVVSGDIAKVAKGAIFVTLAEKHCGIVTKVAAAKSGDALPDISIESDSSDQGGVRENGFADRYDSEGIFYK
jgi:hypothetical protein